MKLRHTLCATLTALLPLCTLTLAPTIAHAQQYERGNGSAPAIRAHVVRFAAASSTRAILAEKLHAIAHPNGTSRNAA